MSVQQQPSVSEFQEAALRNRSISLRRMEHAHLSQLAKCKFILGADRSSSFFHGLIKRNSRRRLISAIAKEGPLLQDIGSCFVDYFAGILGSSSPVHAASSEVCMNGQLVEPSFGSARMTRISSCDYMCIS